MKRTALIVIFPKDSAGIFRGQRLKFFDGDFGHKMGSPYFYPHKNAGSCWTLLDSRRTEHRWNSSKY